MLAGCGVYFDGGDDDVGPDAAAIAEPDAAECRPSLRRCIDVSPLCATGQIELDCPRAEDTSVCYCPAPAQPEWCRNEF